MTTAITRLLATQPNKPNKPKDNTWIKKAEDKQKGKSRNSANDLPEGLFEESAGTIANTLKSKSKDFQQAISRLQFYINRAGSNLLSQDQRRLEQAKEALYRAYGKDLPEVK